MVQLEQASILFTASRIVVRLTFSTNAGGPPGLCTPPWSHRCVGCWSGRPDLNRRPLPPQVVEEEVLGVQTFWPVRIDRIFGMYSVSPCQRIRPRGRLWRVVSHRCPTRIARIRLAVRRHRPPFIPDGWDVSLRASSSQSALGVCELRGSVTTTSGWCGRNTAALEGISGARRKLGPEKGQNSADRQRARLNHNGAPAFMLQQIAVSP